MKCPKSVIKLRFSCILPISAKKKKDTIKHVNLDEMNDDAEEQVSKHVSFSPCTRYSSTFQDKSGEERSEVGSQQAEEDYDVDEEYDNDYAENYFDNGEADDNDDLGGGGGGDEGG